MSSKDFHSLIICCPDLHISLLFPGSGNCPFHLESSRSHIETAHKQSSFLQLFHASCKFVFSYPFPCLLLPHLKSPDLCHSLYGNYSILSSLLLPISEYFPVLPNPFRKWEVTNVKYRKSNAATLQIYTQWGPLFSVPFDLPFFDCYWELSWSYGRTIHHKHKISFLNGNSLLRTHHFLYEIRTILHPNFFPTFAEGKAGCYPWATWECSFLFLFQSPKYISPNCDMDKPSPLIWP